MQGRDDSYVRFVSAYRPCVNKKGLNSVYNQQFVYFQDEKNMVKPDPIKLFDDDLIRVLLKWVEDGDNIVLGIDVNDLVTDSPLALRLAALGIHDAVTHHHPSQSTPATQNCNTQRKTIDGIFVSAGVNIRRCGYLAFDSPIAFQSDHRLTWVEILTSSILKGPQDPPRAVYATKISSKDPRGRKLYQKRCKKRYHQAKVCPKMKALKLLGKKYLTLPSGSSQKFPIFLQIMAVYDHLHRITDAICMKKTP